ncbi:MAG: ferrous iron transport protein A [Bacilli bacterium]|nr:ferrous iron transport protein A [Bacilli bacterium]
MNEMNLCDVPLGKKAIVEKVISSGSIKRRLLDIGLTPGTVVESVFSNPGGNLTAYMIRGALIAIRDNDSKNILIREIES